MGLILGYEFTTRPAPLVDSREIPKKGFKQRRSTSKAKGNPSKALGGLGLGAIIGLIIAIPIFQNDANFRKAVSDQDAGVAIKAALANPEDLNRTLQLADRLQVSGLNQQADELVTHVLENNPRSITAWRIRLKIAEPGTQRYEEARNQINFLNPRIPIK